MFADDTKVYRHMVDEEDKHSLQEDLDALQMWSETWLLRFNASKCKRMHMGNTNKGTSYHLGNEQIPHVSEERDLGVFITEDCKTTKQCAAAASKAMAQLRIIKRTFTYYDQKCFTILYKTYIRPHLEYCIQAWSPSLKKDVTVLEKVQRRATKIIPSLKNKTYTERLIELNLYILEAIRRRGDMIEVYRILNGLEGIEESKLFQRHNNPFQVRGHNLKLYKPGLKKGLNCSNKNSFPSELFPN